MSSAHPTASATNAVPSHGTQHVVLLGAGRAHLQVLTELAAQPLPGTVVTLVTPQPRPMLAGMLPGFMAGHYAPDDCGTALAPLIQRGGMRWLQHSAVALDTQQQTLTLDDGSTLRFDWLSINTGAVQDREALEQAIPGVREHALFVRPVESFAALWPRVAELGSSRPLRVTVIGGGASGIELALAVRQRLPNAAVTLVCGAQPPAAAYPARVQQRLLAELKRCRVTVLQEWAVCLKAGSVHLGCGADLACDVPLLATGPQPPTWLKTSGLALDPQGFVAVDMYQRSTSHSRVFAAGDVSTRMDRTLARSGEYALRAGPSLAHNLAAAITGKALQPHQPPVATLSILTCGGRRAVASWGRWSAQGWWVWKLKDWMDRRRMQRFSLDSK